MQNHGGKAGRIADVRRSHPGRIALFPPIQEGRLPSHQAACCGQHLFILQAGLFQHAGRPEQPVPVPRQAIRLPRSNAPHHPVRGNGPGTARSGILLYLPLPHTGLQTFHAGLDVPHSQPQMGGVRNVPGPHRGPVGSGTEGAFLIDQGSRLVQGQAVRLVQDFKSAVIARAVFRLRHNAPFGIPAVLHGPHPAVLFHFRPMGVILDQAASGQRKRFSPV